MKKKGSNGPKGINGMLAALHPSGTIHVGGSNNLGQNLQNHTDFKMTMKHNSSNHSIQSTKKMIATIRKPTDLLGGSGYQNPQVSGGPSALLGQSNQLMMSGKKNNNNAGVGLQQSSTSNYTSPYSHKNAGGATHSKP